MKAVVIGSGNVAAALADGISACDGLQLVQVCARNESRGRRLALRLGTGYADRPEDVADADIYLIAVSDSAVGEVSGRLRVPSGAVVAHTAGGLEMDVLRCTADTGVLYPFQTFSAGRHMDWMRVPLFVEYATAHAGDVLHRVAGALSDTVFEADGMQRRMLHVAGVFACNFTNRMYAVAKELLAGCGYDFSILAPIVHETVDKAFFSGEPESVQTGPAVRHDAVTIRRHMEMLERQNCGRYREIYELLSKDIWETSKKI
jgi:predicted short-subunit dehydrogenase-like oxidoreductase (DUF2520 family)